MRPFVSLVLLAAACAPSGPPFPPGAVEHGAYVDRTVAGFFALATYHKGITILSVQDAEAVSEPTPEQAAESWDLLRNSDVNGPFDLSGISAAAPRFEAAALKVAEVPGWCRDGTMWSFLPPVDTPLDHTFSIRGSYNGDIAAFIFAGRCVPRT